MSEKQDTPNYVVTTSSWKGVIRTECNTVAEVWAAVGDMGFGGLYKVNSPAGLCTDEFIAF